MAIGHDILIRVDTKFQSYFYRTLIDYIGKNNPKEKPKETTFKNGIRVIRKHCLNAGVTISKGQIRKWVQTRLYYFNHTIIMDVDSSQAIYNALLTSLYEIPNKNNIDEILKNHFEIVKEQNEVFSKRLSILEKIYRELLKDSNINDLSLKLCNSLSNIDQSF